MAKKSLHSALFVALLMVFVSCQGAGKDAVTPAELRGGETQPTLSPAYFSGPTAQAYQIAKEIPEVLDSLYCYCDCEKHFGHKSLLTCFVDEHAAYCDICMDEAFMAYEMHRQGKDVLTIRKAVDERYSDIRH